MKKILISAENLNEHVCSKSNKLYFDKNMIITAGAKDACAQRNIEIVYGNSISGVGNCSAPNCAMPSNSISGVNNCSTSSCVAPSNSISPSSIPKNSMHNLLTDASNTAAPTCRGGINNDPFEQVLVKLAATLKESYGITDLVQLRNLSMEAAKVIKNNL